jgi:hypothetical protein
MLVSRFHHSAQYPASGRSIEIRNMTAADSFDFLYPDCLYPFVCRQWPGKVIALHIRFKVPQSRVVVADSILHLTDEIILLERVG